MDLNGGRRPNVFISNPKNPTMSDFTKCLNSCVNDWQGPASYDKWNALYMDPSGGVSSPHSKAFRPNFKTGIIPFQYLNYFECLCVYADVNFPQDVVEASPDQADKASVFVGTNLGPNHVKSQTYLYDDDRYKGEK